MPYFTYDTSVIISRRLAVSPKLPGNFRLSSIVLMELTASAKDDSELVYSRRYCTKLYTNTPVTFTGWPDTLMEEMLIGTLMS
jgi:hypothetical protein